MKFFLISSKNRTVYNFRGDFVREIVSRGYEVKVTGPDMTDVDKIYDLGAEFIEIVPSFVYVATVFQSAPKLLFFICTM